MAPFGHLSKTNGPHRILIQVWVWAPLDVMVETKQLIAQARDDRARLSHNARAATGPFF